MLDLPPYTIFMRVELKYGTRQEKDENGEYHCLLSSLLRRTIPDDISTWTIQNQRYPISMSH